ncbi:MAG: type I-E CRISPR-associated protein Cse2/CasB [Zymomonas mobilis subsp. pomaceae]|uniref:type I-E CRISPR-associated protein Cse2/CasB n=1 Tax=Zymomonas mobilis TaxID=542 RepID=UPI0039E808BE
MTKTKDEQSSQPKSHESRDLYHPIFKDWWNEFINKNNPDRNRASVAKLKRLALIGDEEIAQPDVITALEITPFRSLYRKISAFEKWNELSKKNKLARENWLTLTAYALAHVKEYAEKHPASYLGSKSKKEGDKPLMNELRFIALMRAETESELFVQARRLIALLNNAPVDVGELGRSLYLWFDKKEGDRIKREWARRYYNIHNVPELEA